MLRNSSVTAQQTASQGGLGSMEIVNLVLRYYLGVYRRHWEKPSRSSVSEAGVPSGIRTKDLSASRQKSYLNVKQILYILWRIDQLLGNDLERNNQTTAIARQHLRKYATVLVPLLGSGLYATMEVSLEAVFPMWSVPRLYPSTEWVELVQCKGAIWFLSEWVREPLRFSHCELLLLDAGSGGTGTVRDTE
jgi:hypothetical protein